MTMRRYVVAALVALPFCTAMASAADDHVLGITGVPNPGGGVRITNVKPDSNAALLKLNVGDTILIIGNEAGKVPMAVPNNSKDIGDVMKKCGDHIKMLVSTPAKGFLLVEGDLTADLVVSLPLPGAGDADELVLVASAPARPTKNYLKNRPRSAREMLRNLKKADRKNVRVVPESVKHSQSKTPKWHGAYKKHKARKTARTATRRSHRAALALPARTEV